MKKLLLLICLLPLFASAQITPAQDTALITGSAAFTPQSRYTNVTLSGVNYRIPQVYNSILGKYDTYITSKYLRAFYAPATGSTAYWKINSSNTSTGFQNIWDGSTYGLTLGYSGTFGAIWAKDIVTKTTNNAALKVYGDGSTVLQGSTNGLYFDIAGNTKIALNNSSGLQIDALIRPLQTPLGTVGNPILVLNSGVVDTIAGNSYVTPSLLKYKTIVYGGDSETDTSCVGVYCSTNYPTQIGNYNADVARAVQVNTAVAGLRLYNYVALNLYASQVAPYKPTSNKQTVPFLFWLGVNDFFDGYSVAGVYANLKIVWAQAKADGFTVVAFTLGRTTNAPVDANVVAVNALIASDPSLYDYLVRPDLINPDPSNLTYFQPDGLHLTAAGSKRIAEGADRVLESQINNYDANQIALQVLLGNTQLKKVTVDSIVNNNFASTSALLAGGGQLQFPIGAGGTGVTNYIPKYSATNLIAPSNIADNSTVVSIAVDAAVTGNLTAANLSGTNTGDQTSVTGNAGTATALATGRTIGTITGDATSAGSSFNGTANNTNAITVTKVNGVSFAGLATGILKNTTTTGVPSIAVAADFPTLNQNTTGNANTATALATPRAINGVNFDGTAPITVTAAASTLTGSTLASGITASSLTSAAGGTFGTNAFNSNSYLLSSGFTTSAINTLYGYTPANGANYIPLGGSASVIGNITSTSNFISTSTSLTGFYQARLSNTAGSGSFGGNSFSIRNGSTSEDLNFDVFNRTTFVWETPISIVNNGAITFSKPLATTSITSSGLDNYGSDLSGSYTSRSKVDKAYVDASKITAGSFSGVGTATTTFTVTIGTTMANTTYKVTASPTNVLSAAVFYITNKTTTTFDVVYLAGLTGSVQFDWHVAP